MRYLLCLLLVIGSGHLSAQNHSLLQQKIDIKAQKVSIEEWFKEIEKHGITLSYNPREIELGKIVALSSSSRSVEEVLYQLLGRQRYRFQTATQKIIILKKPLSYTLSGFVTEFESGEAMIGATLFLKNPEKFTTSNAYGFYSITLPEGVYRVEIRYVGCQTQQIELNLNQDLKLDVALKSSQTSLEEVRVVAPLEFGLRTGNAQRVNLEEQDKQIQIFGIDDALKRIQLLSGVGGAASGLTQLQVRGGNPDNNLVLLDGVPLYNYNHFTGLMSIFNSDALKFVDFYKGTFPARYNGRLSSVIDVRMREGDLQQYHAGASLDMATLSAFVEGPLVKDKSSFLISARRSWIDMISKTWSTDGDFDFSLHDVNIKTNYRVNDRNHLFLSFYSGADSFGDSFSSTQNKSSLSWGNRLAALRWSHLFSNKVFSNTTLSMSHFKNSMENETTTQTNDISPKKGSNTLDYTLSELSLNSDFEFYGEYLQIRLGNRITYNRFQRPHLRDDSEHSSQNEETTSATSTLHEMAYFENKILFLKNMAVNVGLNYNLYVAGKDVFHRFQSRIMLNYAPFRNHSFYAGFSEMSQFFHQLSTSTITLPYEFRMPSSKRLTPGISRLYEIGYQGHSRNDQHHFSASVFLNQQDGVVRYRPQQQVWDALLSPNIENQVLSGRKKGRGIELSHRFTLRRLEWNTVYTLSEINERFSEIENGKYYPSANNSRHVLKSSLNWQLAARHSLTTVFTYSSGQYITVPLYEVPNIDDVIGVQRPQIDAAKTIIASGNNSYRLSDNYQIDCGYTFQKATSKNHRHVFRAGIYNIFGKAAPLSVSVEKDLVTEQYKIKQAVMPHLIPYLSYSFRF